MIEDVFWDAFTDVSENIKIQCYSKLQMCFYPWQYHYDNTTHKYTGHINDGHITYKQLHISHKITPLKANKQNKETNQLTKLEKE
jgi:hypothetical protein